MKVYSIYLSTLTKFETLLGKNYKVFLIVATVIFALIALSTVVGLIITSIAFAYAVNGLPNTGGDESKVVRYLLVIQFSLFAGAVASIVVSFAVPVIIFGTIVAGAFYVYNIHMKK